MLRVMHETTKLLTRSHQKIDPGNLPRNLALVVSSNSQLAIGVVPQEESKHVLRDASVFLQQVLEDSGGIGILREDRKC